MIIVVYVKIYIFFRGTVLKFFFIIKFIKVNEIVGFQEKILLLLNNAKICFNLSYCFHDFCKTILSLLDKLN